MRSAPTPITKLATAAPASKPAAAASSGTAVTTQAGQWTGVQFGGDAARRDKFLALMGAKKGGATVAPAAAAPSATPSYVRNQGALLNDLERQFDSSRARMGSGTRGLGFN
eukprot:TRINITY_DN2007_c0_g1_i2.p3 TRINITY_DN2007_c0_g1~~TRINITY_DN2007_c0_g1_i2.p3  ORF type:complete len:111 (-),score=30.39 TRINITY_DN2007_c0_g1_i2:208-540(-)